ncbi:1,2-dihydroxy-3-keto-5-methylthiopentene dioxygenase [Vermiconidia calcicola]|uniref:1,2-dihydroxy-3-keto-5-methylthiopentene dioxygenase n=1 Tax=Vermiconidia calcicola TaxID=1690605 RepID=A0ACC3NHJ4_9PEZI|nr:1,2-dihydroxy-3-keto-5-methylthiopentene dioxygenase [Vermiconidia calcicola]
MAFQQQGGMNGGSGAAGDHHAQQGTEYTLQGVMRYLQIEWHNHERARNAWEIERAEMKAKIARQEGECRQAKRINEQLVKQIQMLQRSLKLSRAEKAAAENKLKDNGLIENGISAAPEVDSEEKEKAIKSKKGADGEVKAITEHEKRPALGNNIHNEWSNANADYVRTASLSRNSFLETKDDADETSEKAREQYLDNTRKYLKDCMQEIQYLLTPPQHPPPSQALPNGNYQTGLPEPPPSVEDIYARNQQRISRQPGQALPQPTAMPNHQPPPVPNSLPQTSGPQQDANRGARYTESYDALQPPAEPVQQTAQHIPAPYEEQVESVTHSFDSRGRPIPNSTEVSRQARQQPEADGWTFDDESMQPDNPPPDIPPRRPDTDLFPNAANSSHLAAKSPPRTGSISYRRKSSGSQAMSRRRSSQGKTEAHDAADAASGGDPSQFRVKFAFRGHLDVVRSVIFSGGGSPSEPEVCTAGDDGTIKRWIIPASYGNFNAANNNSDLDITSYFTHRGHEGIITSLATCPPSTGFSTGGRASGDGWIFSGGQDTTIRVWERGRVDPKATLEGHTDAVWCVCVLPASVGVVFGPSSSNFGGPDRLLLVSGAADGTIKVWAVSSPPQTSSPSTGSRRGVGGSRRHSVTSGSNHPTSPQPSVASATPFGYTLVHSIEKPLTNRDTKGSPTSICPLSPSGETFVVSYTDSSVFVFDTRTGDMLSEMQSFETYDGTMNTSINTVVATSMGLEGPASGAIDAARGMESEEMSGGATGSREGVEGVVISGHEDRFVRFFDANSGQATYTMLAHPSAIASLSLSKDGREAVSAGHDASIRFWSLEKRICTQDIVSHRAMRGEGVCDVAWSQDGRTVVSAGGDGVVKVFAR